MKFELSEKELAKMVQPAMSDIAKSYEREFDGLVRRYKGRPISEIKPALEQAFKSLGGDISGRELEDYAQLISDGVRVNFRA